MNLVWHWPQLVWLALAAISFALNVAKHGEPQPRYSMWRPLVGIPLAATILYFGGFWAGATP